MLAGSLLAFVALVSVAPVTWMQRPHGVARHSFFGLWQNTCPSDSADVRQLRDTPWPQREMASAPKVSHVIYINMDWDPVRRDYMEGQLQNLKHEWSGEVALTWERLQGVGAEALQKDAAYSSWRAKGFSEAPYPKVAGDWTIASCAYNHYLAINKITALTAQDREPNDLIMIVEDDVEIKREFPRMWGELWQYVPEDWDVLRVGWFGDHQNCSQVVNTHVDLAAWQQLPGGECMYCGAQAYIVNPASKKLVQRRFEDAKITHADTLLSAPSPLAEDPTVVPPLRAFVAWPTLASTHTDQEGFPAYRSDRILGHSAVVETTSGSTTSPMMQSKDSMARSKSLANSENSNKKVMGIDWSAREAATTAPPSLPKIGRGVAAGKATQAATEAAKEVRETVLGQVDKIAAVAMDRVEQETKEAKADARKASREAAKKIQAAEMGRKAAQHAEHFANIRIEALARSERLAEVAQAEASERADQAAMMFKEAQRRTAVAEEARKKAEREASRSRAALRIAKTENEKASMALQQKIDALRDAEAARRTAQHESKEHSTNAPPALYQLPTLPPFRPLQLPQVLK